MAWYLGNKEKAVHALMEYLRGSDVSPREAMTVNDVKQEQRRRDSERKRIQSNLQNVHRISVPASTAPLVGMYLFRRGISIPPEQLSPDVRFVQQLEYRHTADPKVVGDKDIFKMTPAMICVVRNLEGKALSIHRTYLELSGSKANVPDPKKLMESNDSISGGAVHLQKPQGCILGLAEGIETAYAVNVATGLPMWATISANGLEKVQIPEHVTHVVIFADKDRSGTGQTSAIVLQERLIAEGIKVIIRLPKRALRDGEKGVDWLDVLNEDGADNFPYSRLKLRLVANPQVTAVNADFIFREAA